MTMYEAVTFKMDGTQGECLAFESALDLQDPAMWDEVPSWEWLREQVGGWVELCRAFAIDSRFNVKVAANEDGDGLNLHTNESYPEFTGNIVAIRRLGDREGIDEESRPVF